MKPTKSGVLTSLQGKIQELEDKRKEALQRLERAEKQKEEGSRYYRGTELPIDDVLFSIREGQIRSLDISIDFYKKDLERRSGR